MARKKNEQVRREILFYVQNNGPITRKDLANGIRPKKAEAWNEREQANHYQRVVDYVKRLRGEKLLKVVENGFNKRYLVIDLTEKGRESIQEKK